MPPREWTSYYGSVYRCNHPVYRVCTLYREGSKGLCVIQQRYNEKTKATYWSAIDPWLTDKIYLYKTYHVMGGNGTGTELYNRAKALPIHNA